MVEEFLDLVKKKASQKILFLPRAIRQMNHPNRTISTEEVRKVIFEGKIIEDYPEDSRGHSCLILGFGEAERPIHVTCAPKDEYLAIITAYIPDPNQWGEYFSIRRKKK